MLRQTASIWSALKVRSGIPYSDLLSRNLLFTTSTDIIDQVGDETRTLIPDRCVTGNGTATITFPVQVDNIKWYDPELNETAVSVSGAWIIPSDDVYKIWWSDGISKSGWYYIQEGAGTINNVTLYDSSSNGYHATLSTSTVWDTCLAAEKNASNRYGWNEVSGVIIPALTNGSGNDAQGNVLTNSGIAKMNSGAVGGVVAEFGGNKNIVINFSKPLSATWFIEGFNYMNTVTNYAAILGSSPSRFLSATGYCMLFTYDYGVQNSGSGTVIPAFNSNSVNYWKIESLGNGNIEITINETTVIRTYKLTDSFIITTIGYSGSLGPIGLAHNGIYTNFNNEQIYYYNGHAINSVNGVAATNNGVTFERVTDSTPQSTIDLLANKKYIDASGNIIINPQYAKTTETELPAGYFDWQAYGADDPFFLDMNPQDVEIGEIAMQFFDMDAYVGNVTGKAEIHPVEIISQDFYDAENPKLWTSDAFAWVSENVADYPAEYQGFIYWLIKSGQFKNIVAYSPQRSSAENTKINQKGFLPQYTEL